jgi:hypothetical protein
LTVGNKPAHHTRALTRFVLQKCLNAAAEAKRQHASQAALIGAQCRSLVMMLGTLSRSKLTSNNRNFEPDAATL